MESRRSRISCRCRGGRGGREAPIVAVRRRRNPYPNGAPHRVNWKTVRWTVFQEGQALQGRAAPSESPADSPLQGRTPLNELSKSLKPTTTVCIPITYINTYISKYFHTLSRSNKLALLHFPTRLKCFLGGITMYKYKYLYIYMALDSSRYSLRLFVLARACALVWFNFCSPQNRFALCGLCRH